MHISQASDKKGFLNLNEQLTKMHLNPFLILEKSFSPLGVEKRKEKMSAFKH